MAFEAGGDVWVSGYTRSPDFPTSAAFDSTYNGGFSDVFLMRFTSQGALRSSSFLGGDGHDSGAVDIDSMGFMHVLGPSASTDFPGVSGARIPGGSYFIYVLTFDLRRTLVGARFLDGSAVDTVSALDFDGRDNLLIIGSSSSSDLPTVRSYDPTYNGGGDAYLAEFNPTSFFNFDPVVSETVETTGTFALRVVLTRVANGPVAVDYAVTSGTATGGLDYSLPSGTLTFGPTQTTAAIAINLRDDTLQETRETIIVSLSNPSSASLGIARTHTHTILDNDGPRLDVRHWWLWRTD